MRLALLTVMVMLGLSASADFNPQSPPEPEAPVLTHKVTTKAEPERGGNVTSSFILQEGETLTVYAYPNNGYKIDSWSVDGRQLDSVPEYIEVRMGTRDIDITVTFGYSPESPANPGANYFNEATGELIIDDFKPGNLYDAVNRLINNSWSAVSSVIVKGLMGRYDIGYMSNFTSAGTIDLSRTAGVSLIPGWTFPQSVVSVILPSTVTELDYYVFGYEGAPLLQSITCYALEPPHCYPDAFYRIDKNNVILYVPASAIELYSSDESWKDFNILPIKSDAHALQVTLPEGGSYRSCTLELVNDRTGVKQRYVVSDRTGYTFNGLQKDESYTLLLLSPGGFEIGRKEGIVIGDDDMSVAFDSLRELFNVSARVVTPDGADVTGETTVEWLMPQADGASPLYLRKGVSAGEIPDGQELICRVGLNERLGVAYAAPEDVEFTVTSAQTRCDITLEPFREVALSGVVVDGDGTGVNGASVSASQTLNGRFFKSYTARTDRKGQWTLTVLDAPETRLTYAADECVNVNDTIGAFPAGVTSFDAGKAVMKSIVGARITYGFTYHAAGVEEVDNYYPDYQNVAVSVYNVTQDRQHSDLSLQYPVLAVLDGNIAAGDRLRLTATSKTGAFNPIEQTVVIGENQRADVTFDIVGKGGISASFESTDNPAVTAMLYTSRGELLKKADYSEATALFTELEDGDYTLVSMGRSDLMNSILRLSGFAEAGLTEGRDYVANAVKVKSGALTEVRIAEVPAFDESLFYYTDSATTGFSSNKSSITTGNYLTLRSSVDFKGVYKSGVSNVALVVDLPEACDLVEQSVIQGPNLLPYTYDNHRLTVQLGDNYETQVRFCVIPTAGGSFNATASITFDHSGKTVTQPIGSAVSEIKDLELVVPPVIASPTFKVTGAAKAKSEVKIYDEGSVIGAGKVNAAGLWTVDCELPSPYNLSKHSVYAEIITPEGNLLKSATKNITYDSNALRVSKVTMYHWNPEMKKTYISEFDFMNPKTTATKWTVYYPKKVFTYTIEFTANDPERIYNVILYVHTADGKYVPVHATFDEAKGLWYAELDMGSSSNGYYPVNCSVDFDYNGDYVVDRTFLDDNIDYVNDIIAETVEERSRMHNYFYHIADTDALFAEIDAFDADDSGDYEDFEKMLDKINEVAADFVPEELTPEESETRLNELEKEYNDLLGSTSKDYNELLDDLYGDLSQTSLKSFSETVIGDNTIKKISISDCSTVIEDSLPKKGYSNYALTDGSVIYFKFDNDGFDVIDLSKNKRYSIILTENTSSRSASLDFYGYAECGRQLVELIKDLKTIGDNLDNDKTKWMTIVRGYGDILLLTQCYYTGFRSALEYKFNKGCDELSKLWKEPLDKAKKELDNLTNQLKKEEKEFSDLGKRKNQLIDIRDELEANKNLTDKQKQQLESVKKELDDVVDRRSELYDKKVKTKGRVKKAKAAYANIEDKVKAIKNMKSEFAKVMDKIPPKLTKGITMPKWLRVSGKLAGDFGILLQVGAVYMDVVEMIDEEYAWISLADAIDRKLPCEGNQAAAEYLQMRIYSDLIGNFKNNLLLLSGEIGAIGFSAAGGIPLSPTWWAESLINIACEWGKMYNNDASLTLRTRYWIEVGSLRCKKKNCGEPGMPPCPGDGDGGGSGSGGGSSSGSKDDDVSIDPSGFVYEAVPANRVEGVQATIYYKETVEDMYGDKHDEVVLWDAEEYAQRNPLFTDENGMYRWDVPQGLWQVKFEKDGYATTYSEWLPVPPPQLEVNIPITQSKQPEVVSARAYEEGVEVQFDKYMDPSTLTAANIYVTAGGEKLAGTVNLVDAALADEFASEDDASATRYASRVRFVPEQPLSATTGEIRLTVSRNVLSYASIPMSDTYSQVLDVEKEVQAIIADNIKVLYGGEKELTVYAVPFEAAVSRKLHVASSSDLIISVDATELTLDEEGKATVRVKGNLPGRAQLTFTIDDVTAMGECAVDVVTELITAEAPKASRASGTAVYRGTKIELTTDSKDGVIYFTTDGSCPCDANGTRRKYTVPVIINEDTRILAMTAVGTGDDDVSEVVEFSYTLRHNDVDLTLAQGWTWISHSLDAPVDASFIRAGEGQATVTGQSGTPETLDASQAYKVYSDVAGKVDRLSGVARNPGAPIAVGAGCTWLGYPAGQTMTVDEAFTPTAVEPLDVVVGQSGFAQYDGEKWIGTLETMTPGCGYLYYSRSPKNIVYNTSLVSTASARYASGQRAASPYVVDIYRYPSVMPVVATVTDLDGQQLDNARFNVYAFCGSECRGIGRLAGGAVMMSVYGNPGDKITLTVEDADGAPEKMEEVSLTFAESVIGSLTEPYRIAVSDNAGLDNIIADGNIRVSVDGDRLRIRGIAPGQIDLVEVYDTAGRKLIHETKVTAEGIRVGHLVADVYVVVVIGNGEYTYHKVALR